MSGSGTWYPGPGPTDGDDSFIGSDSEDILGFDEDGFPLYPYGGPGNDTLDGRGGDDCLIGGEGDDSILGGDGNDILAGGADNDTLLGGAGNDVLQGNPGNDWIYGGEGSDTVELSGSPDGYTWTWTTIGGGGWWVVDTDPSDGDDGTDFVASDIEWVAYGTGETLQTPCFAAGTRIMTPRGEVPVECLRVGDLVVTLGLAGAWVRPIAWIGHRRVECHRHPHPKLVQPIRLRAGALGPGVPHRDLVLSPDHAVFVDGLLVPAGLLVDGQTILREVTARRVQYFHIELDAHDILLAEGAPAESFLDCGNRHQFANGGLWVALHPDFAARHPAEGCAPRLLTEGPELDRIRAAIARRAAVVDAREALGAAAG